MRPFVSLCLFTAVASMCVGCLGDRDSSPADSEDSVSDKETGSGQNTTPNEPEITFQDITSKTGVDFTYRNGEEADHFSILESLGGGVAIVDYDVDGRNDLCFAGGGRFESGPAILGEPAGLFRNLGETQFVEVSSSSGIAKPGPYSHGVARGDFNADGFPDLLLTGYGSLQLFVNRGDGTFEETAQQTGLTDSSWSSSAAWADFNGDRRLDLFVVHYVNWSFENDPFCQGPQPGTREVCPPREFDGLPDTLYLSNGDGTFRDVSEIAQLQPGGKGLGIVVADLDLDGDVDAYVANDTVPNQLYENNGDATFGDISLMSGTSLSDRALPDGSMGVDLFDYNADGLPDLWVVNYENESAALYENEGKLFFRHVSQPAGVTAVAGLFVGWGTSCFDVDLDGDEDIFVSNGHVVRYPINAPLRQHPLLYRNRGNGRFADVSPDIGGYFVESHMGRGAASGDLDGDGDFDLAVVHTNDPAAILENTTQPLGDWIAVDLIGTASSRDPVGAIVSVRAGTEQVRQFRGGGSYASTGDRQLLFGVPRGAGPLTIHVRWPSGTEQTLAAVDRNSVIRIVEPATNEGT